MSKYSPDTATIVYYRSHKHDHEFYFFPALTEHIIEKILLIKYTTSNILIKSLRWMMYQGIQYFSSNTP